MVMERPDKRSAASPSAASGIKTILFHVHDDAKLDARLQFALSVARTCDAHLHLMHITPLDAYTVVDAFGTFVSPAIIRTLEVDAAKLCARLEALLSEEDVAWDYEEVGGSLMPHLPEGAALADLLITGRESKSPEFEGRATTLLGQLLHQVSGPILVPGDEVRDFDPSKPAIVAWNGTYEAANALRGSVPLLKLASEVILLTVEEDKRVQIPSERAGEYMSRHGIDTRFESRPQMLDTISDEILACAFAEGASYIVMGGYGHNRAGEFLFGGVTRSLLKASPLPLLIAH